jgi:hypothetical protein
LSRLNAGLSGNVMGILENLPATMILRCPAGITNHPSEAMAQEGQSHKHKPVISSIGVTHGILRGRAAGTRVPGEDRESGAAKHLRGPARQVPAMTYYQLESAVRDEIRCDRGCCRLTDLTIPAILIDTPVPVTFLRKLLPGNCYREISVYVS